MRVVHFLRYGICLISSVAAFADTSAPWAYGFKEPAPANWKPAPPAPPAPPSTDPTRYPLPGTDHAFTRAEITNLFAPADYYPGDHPVPPAIVSHGKAPTVWACARCHYYNGQGRPENAGIAGLPADYFVAQLHAFKTGERTSADPRKPNTKMMADYARDMTDEDMRAAAEYYAAQPWRQWIRVVEAERVPQTTVSAGMYLQIPKGGDEALGNRIIEVPEDADAVEIQRSPRIGFIAYVPVGSVKRGEELALTGAGRTVACATCHGPELKGQVMPGVGPIPGLAGRSPSYVFRQLFDMQTGHRTGKQVEFMKPVVANLTSDDMLALAAYLASRAP